MKSTEPKHRLRRHDDDDYYDRVAITTGVFALRAFVVPRFKTSGLSGDEWRISAKLEFYAYEKLIWEQSFASMDDFLRYAPHFYRKHMTSVQLGEFRDPPATLWVGRKGVNIFSEQHKTLGDAAYGAAWHIVTANEGREGIEWHTLTDDEEWARCQQVGCSDKPANVYRYKKLKVGRTSRMMVEPREFDGQFTWYCARHSERGDSDFEDQDSNLELVQGSGLVVQHEADESPAILGGVVNLCPGPDGEE